MTFLDAVTGNRRPQYQFDIFIKQRADLVQWWSDKLEK
jgi:hypothetical protein